MNHTMKVDPNKIDLIMARKQLSVEAVCASGLIAKETFKQVKRQVRNPTPATIGKIAAALGVDVTEIIESRE